MVGAIVAGGRGERSMDRLTFEGNFCDIAQCNAAVCPCGGSCTQKKVWERLKQYEDTGLEPEQVLELKTFTQGGIHKVDDGWKHVQDLLQAEQDGRLVVLPCKVGDTVWLLKKKCKYAGEDNDPWCSCDQYWDNVYHKHMWGCAGKDDEGKQFDCEKRDMEWYAQQIEYSLVLYSPNIVLGKNLFLTREEAEAALKGGEG